MLSSWTPWMQKARFLVLPAWLALTVLVVLLAPRLRDVAQSDQAGFLPADAEPLRAETMYRALFPAAPSGPSVVVLYERAAGIRPDDASYIRAVEAWLNARRAELAVRSVVSPYTAPGLERKLISPDRRVAVVQVTVDPARFSRDSEGVVDGIRQRLQRSDAGGTARPPGLSVHFTGDAAIVADEHAGVDRSMDVTVVVTLVLLIGILGLVYRSPVAPLLPLALIGMAYLVARSAVAWMASAGYRISGFTDTFLIAVLFGAGTDYCLLIVSRFREELGAGRSPRDAAAAALSGTGSAVLSSGLTVIVGFLGMIVARFELFSTTGPSVALGIGIMLAAVLTVLPGMLTLLGERLFWPLRPSWPGPRAGRPSLWDRIARAVTTRPGRFALGTIVVMLPFVLSSLAVRPSYDQLRDIPPDAGSVEGFALLERHFDPGDLMPVRVVLRGNLDWSTPQNLQLLETLSDRLAARPGVGQVRSATRPLGQPLTDARPAAQLARINEAWPLLIDGAKRLSAALKEAKAPALLTGGLDRMAAGFGELQQAYGAYAGDGGLPPGVFFLPPSAMSRPDLGRALDAYLSHDRTGALVEVVWKIDPFGEEALRRLADLKATTAVVLAGTPAAKAAVAFGGGTATFAEVQRLVDADFVVVMAIVLSGVFLVLAFLLRSLVAPLYLLFTILLSYALTLGLAHLTFVTLLGQDGLHWAVPFFSFCVLVALGVDYNIFLMARVREEYAAGAQSTAQPASDGSWFAGPTQRAVRRALAATGGIITSCGLIMAGAFGAMTVSPIRPIAQVGFAAVVGLLIDTFVVRTLLVPALTTLVGEAGWWPGRRLRVVSEPRGSGRPSESATA